MLDQNKVLEESTHGLLKSILDSAFHGIMSFRAIRNKQNVIIDFEWLFINDVAEEILGFKNLIGQNLLKVLPDNLESGLFTRYVNVVETGKLESFEQHYAGHKNHKWFQISVVKLEDGVTVTFQDISNLKEANIEVKTEQLKYQRLFEESIDSIFQTDTHFQLIAVNNSFLKLFGYSLDELKSKTFSELFHDQKNFDLFARLLQNQTDIEEFEVVLVGIDKKKKSCIINCVRVKADKLAEDTFMGIIRDMTKRRLAHRELVQAEKLAMTGKIARTIAHEVRNPLTNLTLALQQLEDEMPEKSEDAKLYFNIIARNADRIGDLITELLNSSKPKVLTLTKQSLNDVVQEAIYLVRDRLKLLSMKLTENYQMDLPHIALDSDQFKVALLNLFINAIEAMEPERGVLNIYTFIDDDRVYIKIDDNGKGLSAEDLSRLFEPYFTGKADGTGLGLTTVQNIVNSHNGRIDAESEEGKGTIFTISFNHSMQE